MYFCGSDDLYIDALSTNPKLFIDIMVRYSKVLLLCYVSLPVKSHQRSFIFMSLHVQGTKVEKVFFTTAIPVGGNSGTMFYFIIFFLWFCSSNGGDFHVMGVTACEHSKHYYFVFI